jgi:predicted GH43/DUF377 family glycosyl hydrolase
VPRSSPDPGSHLQQRARRTPGVLAAGALLALVLALTAAAPARALVRFDFEQKYFRHPGRQVWDFSIVRPDSLYHIFYHTIHETTPSATYADTIWHAASPDLRRWDLLGPVLVTLGSAAWEQGALWAPSVARDETNQRWVMLYTGCDANMNQRIGLATSPDLTTWTREGSGPVINPDPTQYVWNAGATWSNFRDPFLYRQNETWNVLVTALQNLAGQNTGVLYHATSDDLLDWTDVGPLFVNDGPSPALVLESAQYRVIGNWHHLLFGEYNAVGVTILSATDPADWTMATKRILDAGYAPQLDTFDPGTHIYSRLAPYNLPQGGGLGYVVRLDTLRTAPDGSAPALWMPHPLDADWAVRSGGSALGNPTFGDNPRYRGEATSGLVGNGFYGSREYYPGPLSGRGAPGTMLGDAVTGRLESRPFLVTGHRMQLLVGGGNFPNTCYVALVAVDDGTILRSETGHGAVTMTPREWDLTDLRGRMCRIVIVDLESSVGGYINVDEIVELDAGVAAAPLPAGTGLTSLAISPNPANPAARISFHLGEPGAIAVAVYDLRGRCVWRDGPWERPAGTTTLTWPGLEQNGRPAPSGTYLVRVTDGRGAALGGRLTLLK